MCATSTNTKSNQRIKPTIKPNHHTAQKKQTGREHTTTSLNQTYFVRGDILAKLAERRGGDQQPHVTHGFLVFYPFLRRYYHIIAATKKKTRTNGIGGVTQTQHVRPSIAPQVIRLLPCKQTLLQSFLCPACCGNHSLINCFQFSVIHSSRSICDPFRLLLFCVLFTCSRCRYHSSHPGYPPPPSPTRHCRDARVYGHTTTAMHDISTPPPPPSSTPSTPRP